MSDKEENKISEVVSRQDDWSKYSSRTNETSDINVMVQKRTYDIFFLYYY